MTDLYCLFRSLAAREHLVLPTITPSGFNIGTIYEMRSGKFVQQHASSVVNVPRTFRVKDIINKQRPCSYLLAKKNNNRYNVYLSLFLVLLDLRKNSLTTKEVDKNNRAQKQERFPNRKIFRNSKRFPNYERLFKITKDLQKVSKLRKIPKLRKISKLRNISKLQKISKLRKMVILREISQKI